ncbi:Putative transposase of IS4/5 family [Planctomicrobium piriforme]|uniref:Putative transposase of IS4/5 family n=2 Tax=Planctomicrobium piriforme TaxID=1576369 RepID=A0A1I3MZW1_9PLAN|nr:Putative transposase of IS4/5 family [Planctomicrobium piriforme]
MPVRCSSTFHQLPEAFWERIQPLPPNYKTSFYSGRPRLPLQNVALGVPYVLRTGCQWKAMPAEFRSFPFRRRLLTTALSTSSGLSVQTQSYGEFGSGMYVLIPQAAACARVSFL